MVPQANLNLTYSPRSYILTCALMDAVMPKLERRMYSLTLANEAWWYDFLNKHFVGIFGKVPGFTQQVDAYSGGVVQGPSQPGLVCTPGSYSVPGRDIPVPCSSVNVVVPPAFSWVPSLSTEAVTGRARAPSPRGRSPSPSPAGPTQPLHAVRARNRGLGLTAARVPRARLSGLLQSIHLIPAAPTVKALAISSTRALPGHTLTVIAARLSRRNHRVLLVLRGPGYEAARVLATRGGVAGATLWLPRHMSAGRRIIAIIDDSAVQRAGNRTLHGYEAVRIATFTIRGSRKHR